MITSAWGLRENEELTELTLTRTIFSQGLYAARDRMHLLTPVRNAEMGAGAKA